MTKTISIRCPASSSDNPKAAPQTKIGNLKLVWLSVVAVVFVVTGAVAMAQQPEKIFRIGYLGRFRAGIRRAKQAAPGWTLRAAVGPANVF